VRFFDTFNDAPNRPYCDCLTRRRLPEAAASVHVSPTVKLNHAANRNAVTSVLVPKDHAANLQIVTKTIN
jgi:hypothetical protein